MTATVLMVKRYPSEEFAVIMDTSPAVFTLRDVQYLDLHANNLIQEGSRVMLHTVGVWNVHTTCMHRANISLWHDKTKDPGNNKTKDPGNGPSNGQPPLRKRRVAMEF